MSKFDRGVFIFIGLGIWALAMTQIFKPETVFSAGSHGDISRTLVTGLCPEHIKNERLHKGYLLPMIECNYLLVATWDDLMRQPKYFK